MAASDNTGVAAGFTNFGSWVDITAPGVDVASTITVAEGSYGYMSGTSMACPHVAGILALAYAVGTTSINTELLLGCLLSTASEIDSINAAQYVKGGGTTGRLWPQRRTFVSSETGNAGSPHSPTVDTAAR